MKTQFNRNTRTVKVAIVGDHNVGKTALLSMYMDGIFLDFKATIGCEYNVKELTQDKRLLKVIYVDVAGQKMFRDLVPKYIAGCRYCIIIGDATRPESIRNMTKWHDILKKEYKKIQTLAIVNKIDLISKGQRATVLEEYADTFIELQQNDPFLGVYLTSVKENFKVNQVFTKVEQAILDKSFHKDLQSESINVMQ